MKQQKKHKYNSLFMLFIAMISLPISAWADITPTTKNSVTVKVPLVPTISPTELTAENSIVKVQYSDGLGRPTMTVRKSIVKDKDLVSVNGYNAFGEVGSQWLAAPITAAATIPDGATVMQEAKSFYGDQMPYSTVSTTYQGGNQNTVQIGPGSKWHNANKSEQQQVTNSQQYGGIKRYVVVGAAVKLLPETANLFTQLFIMTDEDGSEVFNFMDNTGNLLMQRTVEGSTNHDTYYVYNDMDQLCFVLSPEATSRMTTAGTTYTLGGTNTDNNPLSQYAYAYRYNAKGQCIAKKLPGKDWSYMVYDRGGRLAFSIDGNQHQTDTWKWTFYTYDALNRLAQSGTTEYDIETWPNYDTQEAIVTYVTGAGYRSTSALGNNTNILTQNFYDTYDFINLQYSSQAQKANLTYQVPSTDTRYRNVVDDKDIAVIGKLTGTYVAPLKSSGSIITAMYYDQGGRVIQTRSNNHLGGYDNDTYTYNFAGQVLSNYHVHSKLSASTVSETYLYNYDNNSRLTSIKHSINGLATIIMDSLEYDNTGRVSRKIIHGGMQTIDYGYNVRSQLKSITSPKFSELINYADDDPLAPEAFNGNISSIQFGAGNVYKYKYAYTYDNMNRLKTADYTDLLNQNNNAAFTEKVEDIDLNSNIKSLKRSGIVKNFKKMVNGTPTIEPHNIDELTMEYKGNQLTKVTDGILSTDFASVGNNDFSDKQSATQPTEYFYDANGNQTADYNKGIAWIKYNLLNLPEKIQFCNGNKVEYTYYADGSKKTVQYYTSTTTLNIPIGATTQENFSYMYSNKTEYCGRYVYEDNVMKRIVTPDGYLRLSALTAAGIRYTYHLKDHLGNVHVNLVSNTLVYPSSTTIALTNTTDFYPSGMEMRPTTSSTSGINPYLYGGKELDRMNALNLYDFSARWYDYAGSAFTTMDPHAENHYSESPYSYCAGNPVNRTDPTGMDWYSYVSSGTHFRWFKDENRTSFDGTENGSKVTYTNAGSEIFFKGTDGYLYHGTDTGEAERLVPLATVEVFATPIHPSLTYGSGNSNSISGIAEDRSAGGDNSKNALDIGSGVFAGLEKMSVPGQNNYFLGQNGKYYNKQPNGITGSRIGALKAAKMYKIAGGVATAAGAGAEIWLGIEQDGGTYGYNAQKATASAIVGGIGGWAGAALGAKGGAIVGTAFCPGLGTAIGAAVGAIGGGYLGGEGGSWLGKTVYDNY